MRLLTALLAAFVTFTPLAASATEIPANETAYDRVMRTGVLRCGYYIWEPMIGRDINSGKLHGPYVEIMEDLAKRLELKLEWTEETPFSTYLEGVLTNRYDMGCAPVFALASRARAVAFSAPFHYADVFAVVRKDDHRFDQSQMALNDPTITIAVQDGDASAALTHQKFPQAKLDAQPQLSDYSQLMLDVATGKADATLVARSGFNDFERNNPDKLRILSPAVSSSALVYPLPKRDFAFASMIDGALTEMLGDGTIADILRRDGVLSNYPVPVITKISE